MVVQIDSNARVLIVGTGDLSFKVMCQLVQKHPNVRLVLAGRDEDRTVRLANLVRFTADNLGLATDIATRTFDLRDIDQTAEAIAAVRPDIVFMGASLQSWRRITELPPKIFAELDTAQYGPWLPMHLSLNYLLMQAIHIAGWPTVTVNAAYPDAVGPVLKTQDLAPSIGIGNVANIIPALTRSVAEELREPPEKIAVRLVAQHYFSHYVPRFGSAGDSTYVLSAEYSDGRPAPKFDDERVFARLTDEFRRKGGLDGQMLTASSAVRVLSELVERTGRLVHAPAPDGLPGGYPVRITDAGIAVDLPDATTRDEAVAINEKCQQADGIESIGADGTVTFAPHTMAIMRSMLGYDCQTMALADVHDTAAELGRCYQAFAERHR
ncbi:hypothetical protein DFR70_12256 [Nocardia tenerifensis]|uniref:Uncharacterized protein n=1 Tax=Nocardia tenerifensis TaxID=228006 RepID=A0A318K2E9_9NOCA|nr:hypothetical protein [Nocardia tenerifensis]PXX54915.1 hypothetical protein DFR70_12256 [Nocardia tenerifensis]